MFRKVHLEGGGELVGKNRLITQNLCNLENKQ